jgi:mono/diheme cytochrome c family protein
MRKIAALSVTISGCILLVLGGCSRNSDYIPREGATGEKIFKEACVQCHTPVASKVMLLRADMANPEAIADRVKNGKGLKMPAFPNLTGDSVQSLADYILANSGSR